MIEFFFGEGSGIAAELEPENPHERLRTFGQSPPWLMAITACAMGGGAYLTSKRVKKIGASTVVELENEPVNPRPRIFSSLNIRSMESHDFSCPPDKQKKITEIVNILSENSAVNLAFDLNSSRSRLKTLEKEIDDVPLLNFLWTIFSDQDLKKKVQEIFRSRLKYLHQDGFLIGINKGMKKSSWREIEPYLAPWAKSLGTTKAAVAPLIQKKNSRGLVDHLLK